MGDSGAGKSTFNLELERDLWDAYDKDKKRIPIFITLPAIDKPDHDLIAKHLRTYDFTEEQIRELKSHHNFVLICDGYDECQQEDNLYTGNRLNQHEEWNAQMVISCRSEYLGHDYRRRFQPGNRNDREGGTLLQEVVIAPFSKSQIRHYIEKYVDKYTSHWKVEDYLLALDRIPGLQDLVKNPFLLTLSLWVLPKMVDFDNIMSSTTVTRVALYDEFVEQWIDRGMARLHDKKLRGNDAMVFKDLCNDGFSYHAIRYLKDLAVAIFENQDGAPVVEYSPFRDRGKWQHKFFSQVDGNNLLCEACPIVRIGSSNQHRFIHRSMLEYGLARAVFEPQPDENEQSKVDSMTGARMQRSMSGMDFTSPLCRRSFVNEPSIIRFLAERVQQEPIFEELLRSFIEQSKSDKRWSIPAANAMTILIKAGIRFNGADLKGIRIPGADLSGGQFDSAQLQGADLSNVILRNIWLRQANLSDARMGGVEFGEQPYLTEENTVWSCAYSPDGRNCIFSLDNGTISVYDTLSWTKTYTLQGHESQVNCAVYSPGGHQIASGSDDKT
ncbi:Transducin (beta)-like 1 X-linked receptor 1, partial [Dissophora globulifera]